jgi:hypothetical protein
LPFGKFAKQVQNIEQPGYGQTMQDGRSNFLMGGKWVISSVLPSMTHRGGNWMV